MLKTHYPIKVTIGGSTNPFGVTIQSSGIRHDEIYDCVKECLAFAFNDSEVTSSHWDIYLNPDMFEDVLDHRESDMANVTFVTRKGIEVVTTELFSDAGLTYHEVIIRHG